MCDRVSHTKGMIKKEVKLSTKRGGARLGLGQNPLG